MTAFTPPSTTQLPFDAAIQKIRAAYATRPIPRKKGWTFLYSDRSTLGPATRIMIMGRNPRADAMSSEADFMYARPEISSYDIPEHNGIFQFAQADASPYYWAVCNLFSHISAELGSDQWLELMDSSLLTNFVPYRSRSFRDINQAERQFGLSLWQWIFQLTHQTDSGPVPVLRPRVVICFSDDRNNIEQYMRQVISVGSQGTVGPMAEIHSKRGRKDYTIDGRVCTLGWSEFGNAENRTTLLRLPHPAYVSWQDGWNQLRADGVARIAAALSDTRRP